LRKIVFYHQNVYVLLALHYYLRHSYF
jgi:hypothetical protein